MSFWNLIGRHLRSPFIRVDNTILDELHALAERKRLSKADIVNDLLTQALEQRKTAEIKLASWRTLTPRQQEVVALACLHYTNAQIAKRLSISSATVSTHIRHILKKFNLHSKGELRLFLSDWDFSAWG